MTYKVLIVDDNETHYQLVEDFLENASLAKYDLDWAGDYDTALRLIVQRQYDICLLDYDLGARSGLDFIQEPDVQARGVPIVFLTGRGSMEIDFEAMRGGVVDYLDKTRLQPNTLERAIRYAAERAKALQAEQEHRNFLEALLSVISILNSSLEFEEVVERILMNIGKVIPHDVADFMLVEDGYTRVVKCVAHGDNALEKTISKMRFVLHDTRTFQTMRQSRLPLLIPNIADYPDWIIVEDKRPVQSYLGVPVFNADNLLGFINLTSYQAHFFSQEHSERLQIFAPQAAIAIQNSQQYEQAQQRAAEEERTRLAHELHDSVSQTLFSASVIAETLLSLAQTRCRSDL
ncbi:MAG: response regulator [Anaerolineae bacterium]|nr:response regulator [Anaerolineae bacterium]